MNDEEIPYASPFSGVGGFDLGLRRASQRFKRVWSCDWDRSANKVFARRFGTEGHFFGDIRRLDVKKVPDHSLLVAGFPCQAFSVAGQRRGFQDTHGTLFFDLARIIEAKRPRVVLLENVKGLLSVQKGYCFWRILQVLEELGYWVEWQVLNSKHFGVPQNRERVFVVGHLGDRGGREIFPVTEGDRNDPEGDAEEAGRQVSNTITGGYRKQNARGTYVVIGSSKPTVRSGGRGSLDRRAWDTIAVPCLTLDGLEKRQHGRWFKEHGEPMFTLTAQDTDGVFSGHRIRRLTPVECERLQGFPDGWTAGVPDSNRYDLLGRAVTVNVAEFLAKRILERCFS